MRILVVDQIGGVYRQFGVYRSLADAAGFDVTLLVPKRSHDGYSITLARAQEEGSFHVLPVRPILANRSHRAILPRLWGLLRKEKFDLLYVEAEPESYQALHAALGLEWFSAHTKFVLMSWRNIDFPVGVYPFHAQATHALAERITLPRISGLVAHIGKAASLFLARGCAQVAVIPQAVDVTLFAPGDASSAKEKLRVKKFTVGYVGRFVQEKGIDLLLHASARLGRDHEIILIGRGPEEESLRRLSIDLGILDRIHWVGGVPHEMLPEYYRAMDVLILPSRTAPLWKEQFGRVLIEAMACGIPVVGADSGEIPTTIRDSGLLFAEGDVDGLARQITRIHDDPLLQRRLAERGRAYVKENFSVQKVAELYREFFESVVGLHSLSGVPAGR